VQLVADDVQGVVLADAGHWVAEQAPEQLLAALTKFLAPYRDGPAAAADPEPRKCRGLAGIGAKSRPAGKASQ
jgi:hypothetical protein